MMNRIAFIALALTVVSAPPLAQPPAEDLEIEFGGIQLRLGMTQDDVLRKLAVVYDIKPLGQDRRNQEGRQGGEQGD